MRRQESLAERGSYTRDEQRQRSWATLSIGPSHVPLRVALAVATGAITAAFGLSAREFAFAGEGGEG
jgi:hypothetical protein